MTRTAKATVALSLAALLAMVHAQENYRMGFVMNGSNPEVLSVANGLLVGAVLSRYFPERTFCTVVHQDVYDHSEYASRYLLDVHFECSSDGPSDHVELDVDTSEMRDNLSELHDVFHVFPPRLVDDGDDSSTVVLLAKYATGEDADNFPVEVKTVPTAAFVASVCNLLDELSAECLLVGEDEKDLKFVAGAIENRTDDGTELTASFLLGDENESRSPTAAPFSAIVATEIYRVGFVMSGDRPDILSTANGLVVGAVFSRYFVERTFCSVANQEVFKNDKYMSRYLLEVDFECSFDGPTGEKTLEVDTDQTQVNLSKIIDVIRVLPPRLVIDGDDESHIVLLATYFTGDEADTFPEEAEAVAEADTVGSVCNVVDGGSGTCLLIGADEEDLEVVAAKIASERDDGTAFVESFLLEKDGSDTDVPTTAPFSTIVEERASPSESTSSTSKKLVVETLRHSVLIFLFALF